jgi:hypothetical protein
MLHPHIACKIARKPKPTNSANTPKFKLIYVIENIYMYCILTPSFKLIYDIEKIRV